MHVNDISNAQRTDIKMPVRNNYFYGKLLDVYHFELETRYFNSKRWILNRLVSGYGVICGLDVELCYDKKSIIVGPGIAIDKCGHEIIVPEPSKPFPLPTVAAKSPKEGYVNKQESCEEENFVHVCLCFHECESDPMPVLAGECKSVELCMPGAIHERYEIKIKEGKSPKIDLECSIPEVISGERINYPALAIWVTRACPSLPDDPCVPLANIRLPEVGMVCDPDEIDITIRPIVYTNDLLFSLILAMAGEEQSHARGGKP